MKKKSSNLSRLKRALWHRALDDTNPAYRQDYRHLHEIAQNAEEEVEEMVGDMEMMSLRHPAFPDDFVGYPDDDMRDFEENEAEKKPKKDNQD